MRARVVDKDEGGDFGEYSLNAAIPGVEYGEEENIGRKLANQVCNVSYL